MGNSWPDTVAEKIEQLAGAPDRCWDVTWWTFDDSGGILELDAPAVELHWRLVEGHTLAWWSDRAGRLLRFAAVGVA